MSVAKRIDRVLAEQLGPGVTWDEETSLTDGRGLALDSVDLVELVIGLENEFGIEIPDDDVFATPNARELIWRPQFELVGDVIEYIERRLGAKPALAFG